VKSPRRVCWNTKARLRTITKTQTPTSQAKIKRKEKMTKKKRKCLKDISLPKWKVEAQNLQLA
jgi:hypothetical protein